MKFVKLHKMGGYNTGLSFESNVIVNSLQICSIFPYEGARITSYAEEEILSQSPNLQQSDLSPSKISLADALEPITVAESVDYIYNLISKAEQTKLGEPITKFE